MSDSASLPAQSDNIDLAGGPLDTTEQSILELLQPLLNGRQRRGIFRTTLMSGWGDPQPLSGFRPKIREERGQGSYKGRDLNAEFNDIYKVFNKQRDSPHRSKPRDAMLSTPVTVSDSIWGADYYKRASASTSESNHTVLETSKIMYTFIGHTSTTLHPNIPDYIRPDTKKKATREDKKADERKKFIEARMWAAGLICRRIMESNNKVKTALPITFNSHYLRSPALSKDTSRATGNWPEHFAASITFLDGTKTILPLAIHLVTSRPQPFEEAEPGMHTTGQAELQKGNPGKCAYPWDRYTRPELLEHFEGMPLLNVCDASFLIPPLTRHSACGATVETFYPRTYSATWLLKPSVKKDEDVFPPYFGRSMEDWRGAGTVWQGCERVASLKYIGDALYQNQSRVSWKAGLEPKTALGLPVKLSAFTCQPQAATPSPRFPIEKLINGVASCDLYYDCTAPQWQDSGLCKLHHDRLMSLVKSGTPLSAQDFHIVPPAGSIGFFLGGTKNTMEKIRQRLNWMHTEFSDTRKGRGKIWAVDFEGFCVAKKGRAPIPLRIGFVNVGDRTKYETGNIRYTNHSEIRHLGRAILESESLHPHHNRRRVVATLRRHYGGTAVTGYSMSEWREKLLTLGFNNNNDLVVTWGFTNFDRISLGRILNNNEDLDADSQSNDFRPNLFRHVDLADMFRMHSGIPTTILSFVYRTFCDSMAVHHWHDPHYDADAIAQLWDVFVEKSVNVQKEQSQRKG